MSLDFYVVTNCPMKGLYRNLKQAKRQCQRYETAVLHKFYSPKEISAARACCNSNGIKVSKATWDDLHVAGKMSSLNRAEYKPHILEQPADTKPGMKEQAKAPTTENVSNVIDITPLTAQAKKIKIVRPKKKKPKYETDITNPMLPKNVEAVMYTDASFMVINGKKCGGYAALLLLRNRGDAEFMVSGNKKKAKNNEYMELYAINQALKLLQHFKITGNVVLYSDSKNTVEMFNTNLPVWKKARWRGADKKRIRNWKLWRKIWRKAKTVTLELVWVKGHAGSIWNNRCDHAARVEAQLLAM